MSSLQRDVPNYPSHIHHCLPEASANTVYTMTIIYFLHNISHCLKLITRNALILYLSPLKYWSMKARAWSFLFTPESPESRILLGISKHFTYIGWWILCSFWGEKKSDMYMLKQKNVQDTLLSDKSKSQSNIHKVIHLYKNEYEHIM